MPHGNESESLRKQQPHLNYYEAPQPSEIYNKGQDQMFTKI